MNLFRERVIAQFVRFPPSWIWFTSEQDTYRFGRLTIRREFYDAVEGCVARNDERMLRGAEVVVNDGGNAFAEEVERKARSTAGFPSWGPPDFLSWVPP